MLNGVHSFACMVAYMHYARLLWMRQACMVTLNVLILRANIAGETYSFERNKPGGNRFVNMWHIDRPALSAPRLNPNVLCFGLPDSPTLLFPNP